MDLLRGRPVSTAAMRALRGVCQLELEVQELCRALAARPAPPPHDRATAEEIAGLLAKLLLFRMGLPDDASAHAIQD
ncbi:MAG: hypothetical protein V4582_24430 [Pseudomonadota bacterium]